MQNENLNKLYKYINDNEFNIAYKNKLVSAYYRILHNKKDIALEIVVDTYKSRVFVGVSVCNEEDTFKKFTFGFDELFKSDGELHDDINSALFEVLL